METEIDRHLPGIGVDDRRHSRRSIEQWVQVERRCEAEETPQ